MSDTQTAQEAERQQRKDAERLEREQADADFKWLMEDPRGRRLMHGFLQRAGVFESSYSAQNVEQTAYKEGRRSIGLELLGRINSLVPKSFIKMLEEKMNVSRNS